MATYLSASSNVQADSIQTLHLMNQPYNGRSDAANLMLVNHQAQNDSAENDNSQQHSYTSMGYGMFSQGHLQQQSALAAIYSAQQNPSAVFGNRIGAGGQYGWPTSHELPFLPGSDASSLNQSMAGRFTSEPQQLDSNLADFNLVSQSNSIHGDQVSLLSKGTALGLNMTHVIDNGPTQALSLSLTPQQQQQQQQQPIHIQYLENPQLPIASLSQYNRDEIGYRANRLSNLEDLNQIRTASIDSGLHSFMSSQGVGAGAGFITASKYLRAAQDLLDEVVSVGEALKNKTAKKNAGAESWMGPNSVGTSSDILTVVAAETSPQVRQELQLKKAKLVAMLEEVDRRYRIYSSQMHAIVSSFESAAGAGAAKSYTALALQTISRHFRCLRDAIAGQIRVAGRGLGEEQQSYQYRALQQLQMMQQHAWRPQRGLPERAVSVLRAWLFEHFLHPYPKDSEKILLAKQTGLTRNQVSNWFINARVRLWKPMVEEMYQEELKDSDATPNQRSDGTADDGDDLRSGQRNSLKSRSEDGTSSAGDQGPELQHMARPSEHLTAEEMTTTDSSLLMHEMHTVKKARTSMDSFVTTKTEAYSEVHDPNMDYVAKEEPKLNFPGMVRGLDVQGLGNYLSSSGAVRGGGIVMPGNNNVSLTLGLQHSDVLEAQQRQHYFHHLQGSGHGDSSYEHIRLHDDFSNQFTSGRQQRDLDSSTLTTVQDYYPSITPTESGNNEALQPQNSKHFSAHILQQRDYTS